MKTAVICILHESIASILSVHFAGNEWYETNHVEISECSRIINHLLNVHGMHTDC